MKTILTSLLFLTLAFNSHASFNLNCPERVEAGEIFEISMPKFDINPKEYSWSCNNEELPCLKILEDTKVKVQALKPGRAEIKLESTDGTTTYSDNCQIDVSNPGLNNQIIFRRVCPDFENLSKGLVEITNQSQTYIDLAGWVLYDQHSNELFLTRNNSLGFENDSLILPPQKEGAVLINNSEISINDESNTLKLFSGPAEMTGEVQSEASYSKINENCFFNYQEELTSEAQNTYLEMIDNYSNPEDSQDKSSGKEERDEDGLKYIISGKENEIENKDPFSSAELKLENTSNQPTQELINKLYEKRPYFSILVIILLILSFYSAYKICRNKYAT